MFLNALQTSNEPQQQNYFNDLQLKRPGQVNAKSVETQENRDLKGRSKFVAPPRGSKARQLNNTNTGRSVQNLHANILN